MPKHAGGRPRYTPTDNDRALVRNMAAAGLSHEAIQRCLPTAPKHIDTFTRAFREELDTSAWIVSAKAISKLVVAIDKGEAWAICFWLKCKANFSELQRREHTGLQGGPIEQKTTLEVIYADKTIPE
jgi:hypothetical protein